RRSHDRNTAELHRRGGIRRVAPFIPTQALRLWVGYSRRWRIKYPSLSVITFAEYERMLVLKKSRMGVSGSGAPVSSLRRPPSAFHSMPRKRTASRALRNFHAWKILYGSLSSAENHGGAICVSQFLTANNRIKMAKAMRFVINRSFVAAS